MRIPLNTFQLSNDFSETDKLGYAVVNNKTGEVGILKQSGRNVQVPFVLIFDKNSEKPSYAEILNLRDLIQQKWQVVGEV